MSSYITINMPDECASPSYLDCGHFLERVIFDNSYTRIYIENPLVSIIMPTKDRADCIKKAVQSILNQTWQNWELLIIDDHSSDNTEELIKESYHDKRIQLMKSDGYGVPAARNMGLHFSKGKYIAYLDTDNIWYSNYLEIMLASFYYSEADSCYCILQRHSETGYDFLFRNFDYPSLAIANFIDINIFMHKKELYIKYGGFDETLRKLEDWELALRYTKNNPVFFARFIGVLYDNFQRADRMTVNIPDHFSNIIRNKYLIDWNELRLKSDTRKGISIIIDVHNDKEAAEKSVSSIYQHYSEELFELVVIDNNSSKATREYLSNLVQQHTNITLIRTEIFFSGTLAYNIGVSYSTGEFFVFLSSGTVLSAGSISPLIEALSNTSVMGSCSKTTLKDGTVYNGGVFFHNNSVYIAKNLEKSQQQIKYKAIDGRCLAVRAADFIRIQGFDPLFSNGMEEIDLCLRMGNKANAFLIVPESVVYVRKSSTSTQSNQLELDKIAFQEKYKNDIIPDDTFNFEHSEEYLCV